MPANPNRVDDRLVPLDDEALAKWRAWIEADLDLGSPARRGDRDGPYLRLSRLLATIDALEAERDGALDWATRANTQRLRMETALKRERSGLIAPLRGIVDDAPNQKLRDELDITLRQLQEAQERIDELAEELAKARCTGHPCTCTNGIGRDGTPVGEW